MKRIKYSKRRTTSAFIVLLFALLLMPTGFSPFVSSQAGAEYKANIEEVVLEERSAIIDHGETIGKKIRWSVAFWAKKAGLLLEQEVKEHRVALELAAEKEIQSDEPYLAAYYKLFKERWNGHDANSNQDIRFRLVYIDGDETPEFLLMKLDFHSTGVEVYTYCDDKLIEVGEFGSFGSMHYVERKGLIHSGFFNGGAGETGFYRLEKGVLEEFCFMSEYEREDIYEIDGIPVSKEAYNAKRDELWSDDYISIGYNDGISVEDILDLKELLLQEAEDLKNGVVWKG